jgi:uncharacterized membrane protein YczE
VTGLLLPVPSDRLFERFTRCIGGLALFGLGAALFIGSDLGAAPWDVFHQGVANQTGLPLGLVIQMTGLLIVASWYPLGLRPGWGTLLNAIEIGLVVMLAGIALGGTAGVGTAVFAFGIGPVVHYWMPRLRMPTLEPAMTLAA